MIDTLADLVPLYGMVLVIGIWWVTSTLFSKSYSNYLEYHDKMKIKLAEELKISKYEVIEIWFNKKLKDLKGVYLIDNKIFSDYVFTVEYIKSCDKYKVETFKKIPDKTLDF